MSASVTREWVREALEALYDNVGLSQAHLVDCLPDLAGIAPLEERAELLRSLLLEAIESLRPKRRLTGAPSGRSRSSAGSSFGSPESRSYDVLTLRYLEQVPVPQMEIELSLGRRQIYRDLEEAEAKLAKVLASRADAYSAGSQAPDRQDPLTVELAALNAYPAPVALRDVVQEAIELVQPLADESGAAIELSAIAQVDSALADRAVLRQLLVQLLCCALQSGARRVNILLDSRHDQPVSDVSLHFTGNLELVKRRLADAQRIAASRGMPCQLVSEEGGFHSIRLRVNRGEPISVLVVEDNPGAVELYRRYLSSGEWQLRAVSDPRIAHDVARETRPDVIVLDIMMPRLDGWTVLRLLRDDADTASIPILICSVVEQPELGAALGAKAYLAKPVSQGQFLTALRDCLRQASPAR